jgi:hypothetical protein
VQTAITSKSLSNQKFNMDEKQVLNDGEKQQCQDF